MNELFDKLIIRLLFTIVICLLVYLYKYFHVFLYPSTRYQLFRRFFPSQNPPNSIHLLSRLIGIGIIFSELHFYMSSGIMIALLEFVIQAISLFIIYLASIYILESIILYNFEYSDEIIKRKNYAYSIITFAISISLAFIIKTTVAVSKDSILLLFFIWPLTLVVMGFASKTYAMVSKLPFNRLLIQKNLSIAFSFSGFIIGWALIISSSIHLPIGDVYWYTIHVILKLLLSIMIFPLFKKGIIFVYKFQEEKITDSSSKTNIYGPEIGIGIYEGTLFITACYFTTVITNHIHFGTFYPLF